MVDKLVKQCIETIEEVNLAKLTHAKIKSESKCSFCIVYIVLFWIFLQLMLVQLLHILFTINTQIVINKVFLYMIVFIINHMKWE